MIFVILCFLLASKYAWGECSNGCSEPTLFYEDLKCKPVFASPSDCCPSQYDCANVEEKAKTTEKKCYFHGKTYNLGEQIDDDETYGNCEVGCRCSDFSDVSFVCAALDCPSELGGLPEPKPGCHGKYELDHCCTSGVVCPPFKARCEVDGKTYHEGQEFYPSTAKCTKCVCQEGFEGKFEAPFCKKQTCIDEVRHQKEVYSFCAPSYRNEGDCCPWTWVCPEKDDKIVPASAPTDLKCKFGDQTLNIGDKLERTSGDDKKVSCECRVPPYLTCVQNYYW